MKNPHWGSINRRGSGSMPNAPGFQIFFFERIRAAAAHAPVRSHRTRAPSRNGQLNVGSQKVVYVLIFLVLLVFFTCPSTRAHARCRPPSLAAPLRTLIPNPYLAWGWGQLPERARSATAFLLSQ